MTSSSAQDANDDRQVARQTQHGRDDYSSGREDVGIERLFCASWPGHQDIACDDKNTRCNEILI